MFDDASHPSARMQARSARNASVHVCSDEKLQQWDIWSKSKGRCWYCGVQTHMNNWRVKPDKFTIDHVIPKNLGGNDDPSNLVPACHACNVHKGAMSLEAFRCAEARRRANAPIFTQEHIEYLQRLQIPLPPDFPSYPVVIFWFECREED